LTVSNSSVRTSASPSAPPLARLLFGLLLAWAAVALAYETATVRHDWNRRQENVPPCLWRFGMAPVERLGTCLAGVKGLLPRDTLVLFSSPTAGPCDPDFYRWRWAAYLLPDLLVARANDGEALRQASYLITYRRQPEPLPGCRLDLVRQLDGGRLYRIHHL
jgi:hypothetical protein